MTADQNCELLGEVPRSFRAAHTRHGAQGSSGAPLVLMDDESAVIIGIKLLRDTEMERTLRLPSLRLA